MLKLLSSSNHNVWVEVDESYIKYILTEDDSYQCPSYPNTRGTGNHPDYLNQPKTMDLPLMVLVYHQLHAESIEKRRRK